MDYDPDNLAPGTVLDGRLRIEDKLGNGSFATVYRARHTGLDKSLAMKVLNANIAMYEGSARRRFFVEARLLARIRHDNIVYVYDVVENGLCFITMELIVGEDAYTRMRRGPLSPLEALFIVDQVLQGLEAVHTHNPPIYHRDIKPENIRLELDADGNVTRVVLIDFGVAHFRPEESAEDRQMTDMKLGTYAYMSPEQEAGDADVDHRTDIFAVGAVLWALLNGRAPTNIVLVDKNPKLLAGIPKPVADIIRCAVQFNMNKRYPTAAAMRLKVREAMVELSRSEVARRPWFRVPNPFAGRTVNVRAIGMIAAMLTIAVGGGMGWRMMTSDDARPATDVMPPVQVASRTQDVPTPTAPATKATAEPAAAVELPQIVEPMPQPIVVQATVESQSVPPLVETVQKPTVVEKTPVVPKPKVTKPVTPPDTTPRLVHKVVKKATAGSTVPIHANVKNVGVKEVWLFWRTVGTTRWDSMRMATDSGYSSKLTAVAPGVEYYIDVRPTDSDVTVAGDGDRDHFHTIVVN